MTDLACDLGYARQESSLRNSLPRMFNHSRLLQFYDTLNELNILYIMGKYCGYFEASALYVSK